MPIVLPIIYKDDPKGLKDAENSLNKFGGVAKGIGVAAGAAFAAAAAGAIAFGAGSLKAAAEAEAVSRGLENAAKNAGVFGSTAADIDKATGALDAHSTKLAELTGIDDELFNSIKTGWLAVPELAALGTDGINNLASVTADVAAGTGKDLSAIATAFTKVAGDEETALSKLTKQGIVLTDSQKEIYQSTLDTSGEMAAQAYLVEQLGEKYKGAAEAAANPFDRLKVIFENLMETVGTALLPAIENLVPIVADFITNLTASPEFQVFLEELTKTFGQLLEALMPLLPPIMDLILMLLPPLMQIVQALAPIFILLVEAMLPLIESVLPPLLDLFMAIAEPLLELLTAIMPFLPPLFDALGKSIKFLVDNILKPFIDVISAVVGWLGDLFGFNNTKISVDASARTGDGNGGVKLAAGGVVLPRPGGTLATIGEAGSAEAVIPLDRLEKMVGRGGGNGTTVVVNGNVGWNPEELARQVARKQRQAYALAGITGMVGVA